MKKAPVPSRTNMLPPDPIYVLKSDMRRINNMCFSDQYQSQLIVATDQNGVYYWDLDSFRQQHKQDMGKCIQAIHSVRDKIITQEKLGIVKLWKVNNIVATEVKKYEFHSGFCRSILVNNLIVIPQVKTLDLVDIETFTCIRKLHNDLLSSGPVLALERVNIGDRPCVMAGYESGDVLLWDITACKPLTHQKFPENILSLTYDSASRRGVCGFAKDFLQVFNIDSGCKIVSQALLDLPNEGTSVVKLRPDKKLFVSGGWDHRIRMFSWKTLRTLAVLTEHIAPITDVCFSLHVIQTLNSNIMAVSDSEGLISLWDIYR